MTPHVIPDLLRLTTATMRAHRSSGGGVGKIEEEEGRTVTTFELYRAAKEARGRHIMAVSTLARSQGRPQARLEARRSTPTVTAARGYCSTYLQNCHSPNFTNYSQIYLTTQKSPKTKVVQNPKFYNFSFITIPKFGLHFEMQI